MLKPKNSQKFHKEYSQLWTSLCASSVSENYAFCQSCSCNFNVQHGRKDDHRRYVSSNKHQDFLKMQVVIRPITSHFQSDITDLTTKATVLFIAFLVEHNLPLGVSNHVGPLFNAMSPDSKIILKYACKRTKTTTIVQALADCNKCISIATDGSHHAGEETLYLIVVIAYRSDLGKIVSEVLAVPLLNEGLQRKGLSWNNCFCFAADICSTMTGQYKGTAAFISKVNPNIYIQGCACHIVHIATQSASKVLPVSMEDLLVDLYYYLDKSAFCHQKFKACQVLCDTATHKILKHTSTMWHSLKDCVDRLLEQWPVLENFFLHETALSCKHSKSGPSVNSDIAVSYDITGSNTHYPSMVELIEFKKLSLYQSRSCTVCFSKILYQYLPRMKIHVFMFFAVNSCHFSVNSLLGFSSQKISEILTLSSMIGKYKRKNGGLEVGVRIRSYINDSSVGIAEVDVREFYSCVQKYLESACKYIVDKFPLENELLTHASVADVNQRENVTCESLDLLCRKFSFSLSEIKICDLELEFAKYQAEDLPQEILMMCDRMDVGGL
ncbi:hypothetical protein PR048_013211 [Dryococelus australis]|uniref:DUF4371 domain-containing protein n=1 Tax=Dryococelus australis TaxID=614101 RepID=A0ABQ9HRH2_9NEOP|nr:hypothetical protein PR048_013211 [Dryococelus australis]